jgi:ABC-type branched-subunit amino acid transport system substrate-binding protein
MVMPSFIRRSVRLAAAGAVLASLAGCIGAGGPTAALREPPPGTVPDGTVGEPVVRERGGPTIGAGSVKVALILPLTAPGQAATAAVSLRNAAELAMAEFQNPDVTILVKDDRGTPEGAREAAQQALAEGAEMIIGPLFAGSVQAAGQVARPAGRPVIAFSTDASVATRGVYLLSFLPQSEVDRIVDYATRQGRRSFAALVPETAYGGVVEAQFREATARRGARVVAIERYAPGAAQAAIGRLAPAIAGAAATADALFLPENAEGLAAIGPALRTAGLDPQRVKPLGTGVWNEPAVFQIAGLQGGWYAAPDSTGFEAFAGRYRAKFGSDPTRLATLSYDGVSLAAALVRTQGSQRFSEGALTNPSGFAGADGVFRLRADGTSDRALAVYEIRDGAGAIVSPAPRALGGSAT